MLLTLQHFQILKAHAAAVVEEPSQAKYLRIPRRNHLSTSTAPNNTISAVHRHAARGRASGRRATATTAPAQAKLSELRQQRTHLCAVVASVSSSSHRSSTTIVLWARADR